MHHVHRTTFTLPPALHHMHRTTCTHHPHLTPHRYHRTTFLGSFLNNFSAKFSRIPVTASMLQVSDM